MLTEELEYQTDDPLQFAWASGYIDGYLKGWKESLSKGKHFGEKIASIRYGILINLLIDFGYINDLRRATNDEVFRNKLFEKYGIDRILSF